MRRRCGGPGGWPGGDGPGGGQLGDPAEVRRRLVFRPTSSSSMEGGQTSTSLKRPSSLMTDWFFVLRTSSRSRGRTKGLQRSRLETLWNRRLKGSPDVRQLGVMVQRPNAVLNYTSVSYSP
ncbi:unnamed protein product [Arctogadus glacialis]